MNQKQCLKCGHNAEFPGAPPLACPKCGAIYSKVEQVLADQGSERSTPSSRLPANQAEAFDVHIFAADMRSDSLYPTWRELVKWTTLLWYVVAAIVLLAAVISSKLSFVPTLIGFGAALAIVIFARAGKEISLMLADLSDATVRQAARAEQRE